MKSSTSHAKVNKAALILKKLFKLKSVNAILKRTYTFRGSEEALTRMIKFVALVEGWPKKDIVKAIKEIAPTKKKNDFEVVVEMDSYKEFLANIEERLFIKSADFKQAFKFEDGE